MTWNRAITVLLLSACVAIGSAGCAGTLSAPKEYDYFAEPAANDAWSPKIGRWQRRSRAQRPRSTAEVPAKPPVALARVEPDAFESEAAHSPVLLLSEAAEIVAPSPALPVEVEPQPQPETERSPDARVDGVDPQAEPAAPLVEVEASEAVAVEIAGDLRQKYSDFRSERRRALARELSEWIQGQAQVHYKADGPLDRWATLEETLRRNGDDCDGLELLVYDALLSLGFDRSEVFRAVVYRPEDLQHHMVTLWFEDPKDPWVIDPTGAMTDTMQRMSDLPGWVPLKVFGVYREFTVQPATQKLAHSVSAPVAQN